MNPAHLDRTLRDAVCEQCHLKGEVRVERAGRKELDYRPGLPLHEFLSVFFSPEALAGKARTVGHVEQMHASRCFRQSGGRLGCISCHDPHGIPAVGEKIAFYRGRCLECHADKGCTLPQAERLRRDHDDSCIGCHMPRVPSEDIAHTAITIHEIPRNAAEALAAHDDESSATSLEGTLVPFHEFPLGTQSQYDLNRDLGIALSRVGLANRGRPGATRMVRKALPLLDDALKDRPGDLAALEAKAVALWLSGQPEPASEVLANALTIAPERQTLLQLGASLAANLGRRQQAILLSQRAVALGGTSSEIYWQLAELLAQDRQWDAAAQWLREGLRLNPTLEPARKLLIQCYLESQRIEPATTEFATLVKLEPLKKDALLRWFEEQKTGLGRAK
ncbi:MAG: hypothetical protein P4L84_17130 [Isosphaeraceae bacterium]|nr:hypothetical protein [Isosphaeraceae bacterium]